MTRRSIRSTLSLMVLCALISGGGAVYADRVSDAVALLSSINKYDRRAAIESLSALGDARAIQPLINRLGSPSDCSYAADALGTLGAPAVGPLVNALGHKNPMVRACAARALGLTKSPKAVKPLLDLLDDAEPEVRISAVEALESSKDPSVVAKMLTICNNPDETFEVQHAACNAIVRIGDKKAIDVLLTRLADGGNVQHIAMSLAHAADERVARALILAIGAESGRIAAGLWREAGEPVVLTLINLLKDTDAAVRAGAAWGLSGILEQARDLRALQPLISALKDPSSDVRLAAIEALGILGGEPVVEPVLGLLKDSDEAVRIAAMHQLRRLKDPRAVEPLCAMLPDASRRVRQSIFKTLEELGDPRCVDAVLATLKNPDPEDGWLAYHTLGATKDPRVLQPLLTALKDSNPVVRSAAAHGLGRLGIEEAVEPLIESLKDQNSGVQQSAVAGLVLIGDPRAVPLLIEMLKTKDMMTRIYVGQALGFLKDRRAVQPLLELARTNPQDDSGPISALAEIGDPSAVEPLLAMLDDKKTDKETRMSILWEIGSFKDRRATPALLAAIEEDEEEHGQFVLEALIEIRDPRAFDMLAKIVLDKHSAHRWNAAWALSMLDDPRVDALLMPYAEKGDMEVIAGADQFFIKRGVERAIPALIDALNYIQPESTLPEGFMASGRPELVQAAKEYRATHPMAYQPEDGITYARWGEARR